ncbi:DUF3363 domain-containing protein [Bradyrhizobium sp.]|uniref:DUF3363 domain-containing protein n=1 Tax=Bradyrhizobium sp. TaxID=376 RepID=UPI0025BAFFD8|nr:DUF3363 domain-containing protein [Bradyrhizobium sp.]
MLTLNSGRFALIEPSHDFALVPWRPVLERARGHMVTGSVGGEGIPGRSASSAVLAGEAKPNFAAAGLSAWCGFFRSTGLGAFSRVFPSVVAARPWF